MNNTYTCVRVINSTLSVVYCQFADLEVPVRRTQVLDYYLYSKLLLLLLLLWKLSDLASCC